MASRWRSMASLSLAIASSRTATSRGLLLALGLVALVLLDELLPLARELLGELAAFARNLRAEEGRRTNRFTEWRPGYAPWQFGSRWRAAIGELMRSPSMRAERAKLKSRRDDMIIAQGKRSAALGYGRKMIFSFFLPVWRASARQTGRKKEVGWGGFLPRAAASAALPWAIVRPPLRGSGQANQITPADGGGRVLFAFLARRPAAAEFPC